MAGSKKPCSTESSTVPWYGIAEPLGRSVRKKASRSRCAKSVGAGKRPTTRERTGMRDVCWTEAAMATGAAQTKPSLRPRHFDNGASRLGEASARQDKSRTERPQTPPSFDATRVAQFASLINRLALGQDDPLALGGLQA